MHVEYISRVQPQGGKASEPNLRVQVLRWRGAGGYGGTHGRRGYGGTQGRRGYVASVASLLRTDKAPPKASVCGDATRVTAGMITSVGAPATWRPLCFYCAFALWNPDLGIPEVFSCRHQDVHTNKTKQAKRASCQVAARWGRTVEPNRVTNQNWQTWTSMFKYLQVGRLDARRRDSPRPPHHQ